MNKERLDEIKDSINFQYELIVSKGIDKSALLFTDEEQELVEEIERLNGALQTHEILLKSNVLEIERLNNIINRTTKYVQSLSSSGRGCDIYEDIKQEILKELKGSDKE